MLRLGERVSKEVSLAYCEEDAKGLLRFRSKI
jgi:hypothetical protein